MKSVRETKAESRRLAALAQAEREVEAAEQAKVAADATAAEAVELARHLSEQLADAKRREDDALLDVRRAEVELQKAKQKVAKVSQR